MLIELMDFAKDFDPRKIITSHNIFAKRNTTVTLDGGHQVEQKMFNDASIFSPAIFGNLDIEEEYSCQCGRLTGQFYDGVMCDKCGTKVVFNGLSVDRFGWIDLSLNTYNAEGDVVTEGNGIHILKYIAYQFLEKLIGRESLKNIIHVRNTLNLAGEIDEEYLESLRAEDPKMKYWYYGITKFYDHYNEIIKYYYELNGGANKELYDYLRFRDSAFVDKIPVVSPVLRPVRRTADGIQVSGINIYYQNILKELQMIADPNTIDIVRDIFTEQIQADYFQLCSETVKMIQGKDGLIKEQLCGTRINFSARNIISPPGSNVKMCEIELPYQTFLELWRFELIHILMETEGLTIKEAEERLFKASVAYDDKIWMIMNKVCQDENVYVLFGRNPSINFGSVLSLRVRGVKQNIEDMTASASNLICSLMASDYDGDVLNIVSLKDKAVREVFDSTFSPTKLLISPNDGMFHNDLNLERDQIMALSQLLTKPIKYK